MVRIPNPASTAKIRSAVHGSTLSQAKIARAIGVSDVAVHKYMTGDRKPAPANLLRLAEVLGVKVRDLTNDPMNYDDDVVNLSEAR